MKRLYGVYLRGEWLRNIGIAKAELEYSTGADQPMSKAQRLSLQAGQGLYVDANIVLR